MEHAWKRRPPTLIPSGPDYRTWQCVRCECVAVGDGYMFLHGTPDESGPLVPSGREIEKSMIDHDCYLMVVQRVMES